MKQTIQEPKLTLVGAGPGAKDLITLRGMEALKCADVILYDALANEELLNYAPSEVPRIFVGKRCGAHSFQQEEINRLIVYYAKEFGHVVRLKGGDPFVFGRGFEEILFASKYKIKTAVVPGISSVLSVPALQNIPITHRGINESFWVLTGTTKSGGLSKDIPLAAQSSASIVIVMGMRKLTQICEVMREWRGNREPVAIIQNGSRVDEKFVVSNIQSIESQVIENEISSPAIIIIGEVVRLYHQKELLSKVRSLVPK